MELLREAVAIDNQCALAWEALAIAYVDWTMPGFVKAGAAARRALELNESLPGAWVVLAEIAEEETRWTDSEEYFLRALYSDPTNYHANAMYSEALLARGRVREALHYALEAYRFEPASFNISWRVAMAAAHVGDADTVIKYAEIAMDISGERHPWALSTLADGYLLKGETGRALEIFAEIGDKIDGWLLDCVQVRDDPSLAPGALKALREAHEQYMSGKLNRRQAWAMGGQIVSCGVWLGEPDVVFDVLLAKGLQPFVNGTPTEIVFINMFSPDGGFLRQDPRFRELVVESGLLDYWRQWGWSDYCEADGDSFRCD
jgi:tetratricopeptide (TPR) repeat protein